MRRPRSIRIRLLLAMLMALLTLTIATSLSALTDLKLFREHMLRDLQVLAAVVGENCVSALVLDNPTSAGRNLTTLGREYQVQAATLYDANEAPFARWRRAPEDAPSQALAVMIEHPLRFDQRPVGRLVLEVRLEELARQAHNYVWFASALALLTLATALLLALWLQRRIAQPILNLVEAARTVSERQDFSLRVPAPRAAREIGTLVQSFNQMLAQIEQREAALDQANATLRRLATDLSLLEESEKARLAAELHDGPMQKLALAQMQIDAAAHCGGDDGDADSRGEAAQQHAAGIALMREAIGELRTLQFDLSPPVLHQRGLSAALDWLASNTRERWGIDLRYAVDADLPTLSRQQSVILFQCARELVYNLIKHSGASRGMITLTADAEGLELTVEDNGRGFDTINTDHNSSASGGGYGLYRVRERLQLLGGSLDVESDANGTLLLIRLPLPEL